MFYKLYKTCNLYKKWQNRVNFIDFVDFVEMFESRCCLNPAQTSLVRAVAVPCGAANPLKVVDFRGAIIKPHFGAISHCVPHEVGCMGAEARPLHAVMTEL